MSPQGVLAVAQIPCTTWCHVFFSSQSKKNLDFFFSGDFFPDSIPWDSSPWKTHHLGEYFLELFPSIFHFANPRYPSETFHNLPLQPQRKPMKNEGFKLKKVCKNNVILTGSLTARPWNFTFPKGSRLVFQPSFFRGKLAVKLRGV